MGVFFVLLLAPMVIRHVSVTGRVTNYQKKHITALTFFFVVLTILVMFRHESVGNDTRNYIYIFENISRISWGKVGKYNLEVGFSYFNKIVSLFSKNAQFFLAVSAITVTAMIYPTYRRLCIDSSLTIVLYCTMSTFVMMFSGIRQMLAISIGFIAYEFTRRKRLIPFILAVLLAITFHTSAFMLIFMYPLYHTRITKKWLIAVVPSLAVVFVFNQPIFSFLSTIVEQYTRFEGGIESTGAYTMLILFAIFAVFVFVIPDDSAIDEETIGLRNFLLLSLMIQMFAPLHNLAMRMNYYYIIFIPLLLPKAIACRSKRWNQIALLGRHSMVVFLLIYFFINAYSGSNLRVFPYHFFWESVR